MKGRGATFNPLNKYLCTTVVRDEIFHEEDMDEAPHATKTLEVFPKTLINKVKSPDLPFMYSMNPYQGCEHGCAYCYARPTHEYWDYSAGLDFESVILVKKNAPEILTKELRRPIREVCPIVISGNTDCYQPVERTYQLTRSLLQVCLAYRYPVSIITKNALIVRDLDILIRMAEKRLVSVLISITATDEKLRRLLEPRTSTYVNRFKALQVLSENGIPCGVMVAPIIPGLNDNEMPAVLKQAAVHGAKYAGMTIVRLNDAVEPVFTGWLEKYFPERKNKVLSLIASCHGGNLSDSRWGKRFRGEGKVAEAIQQLFQITRRKYFPEDYQFEYDTTLYTGKIEGENIQGSLF